MFEKMSKALTRADIEEIEENLGLEFPEDFVEHYLSYNGGMPTEPYFYSEEEDIETEVQVFLSLKYPCSDIPIKKAEEKYSLFKGKSPLMTSYFPFANDYGANPICVNLDDEGVIYTHAIESLKHTNFHFLIADGPTYFITSNNPSFVFIREDGLKKDLCASYSSYSDGLHRSCLFAYRTSCKTEYKSGAHNE